MLSRRNYSSEHRPRRPNRHKHGTESAEQPQARHKFYCLHTTLRLRLIAVQSTEQVLIAQEVDANAEVAQLVEQWIENPCVGGSSPPLGTTFTFNLSLSLNN